MTITEALKAAKQALEQAGVDNAALDCRVMLAHVLNCDSGYLFVYEQQKLTAIQNNCFDKMVARRAKHEPVQYIINHCEFMSLPFYVDANVLIPRSDTENLVEAIIAEFNNSNALGLDLCTGSGCVAVSLVHYCSNIHVTATDISSSALAVARRNAAKNNVESRISFIESDMFAAFDKQNVFDFIVSNPPYIETSVIDTLEMNVKNYEPHVALDGGVDGLDFYKTIASEAKFYLKPNALLFLEIGSEQAVCIADILKCEGFCEITVIKDLAGLDRGLRARVL